MHPFLKVLPKAKAVSDFLWKHLIDYEALKLGGIILVSLGQAPKISVRYYEIRHLDKTV